MATLLVPPPVSQRGTLVSLMDTEETHTMIQYKFNWEIHSSPNPWSFSNPLKSEADETSSVSKDDSQSSKKPSKSEMHDEGCDCEVCECDKD